MPSLPGTSNEPPKPLRRRTPELAKHVPSEDALAVRRPRDAGAIIFGKTNTPMYAGDWQTYNDVYGRTSNPWDASRPAA
jgi:amidase